MHKIRVGHDADNRVGRDHLQELRRKVDAAIEQRRPICFVPARDGRFFCSGFDLGDLMAQDTTTVADTFQQFLLLTRTVFHAPVPVSVLAHGHAIGIGAMLCLAADASSMQEKAKFRFPECQLGLGLFDDLIRLIRYRATANLAEALVRQGRAVDAGQAHQAGLVTHTHDQMPDADDLLAPFLNDIPEPAFAEMKRLCRSHTFALDIAEQVRVFMRLWALDATQERMQALVAAR